MDNLLIGIGVVVLIIAAILAIKFIRDKKTGREEAIKFLEDLEQEMYNAILECIAKIDPKKYSTLVDYEKEALSIIYDRCWRFVRKHIDEAESQDLITVLALKFLTRDNIDSFIEKVMNDHELLDTLTNEYGVVAIEESSEEMIEEDKELEEKYSDQDQYVEDSKDMELPPAEAEGPTEEQLAQLNPQQDIDEEIYDSDDESVEEITDFIIKKVNRAGKTTYTQVDGLTGKKKQVSKQYAIESGLEIREEE